MNRFPGGAVAGWGCTRWRVKGRQGRTAKLFVAPLRLTLPMEILNMKFAKAGYAETP